MSLSSRQVFGRRLAGVSLAIAACALFVSACGSRGPLEYEIVVNNVADAATDATEDALFDAAADARLDARPEATPSLIDCGTCITQKCGQNILTCIQNPGCQQIFQCVAQKCFGAGAPDTTCIFNCAQGDLKAAAQVLTIFSCITTACGKDCSALLGGLGGGFPGGGGGRRDAGLRAPGPRGDGTPEGSEPMTTRGGGTWETDRPDALSSAERRRLVRESFSRWPELCGSLD
jgi:predicted small lipoprotein YifL